MTIQTIIKKLERKFPDCWFKELRAGIVTSGEGSIIDGLEAFNYNSWESDPSEKIWTMGVNNDLMDFVEKLGYFWECQDAGTYNLFKV